MCGGGYPAGTRLHSFFAERQQAPQGQRSFENLEESAKDEIVKEPLRQGATGATVFGEHILEHGSEKHRQMALKHLLTGLLKFPTNPQGSKSVFTTLKESGKETLDRVGSACASRRRVRYPPSFVSFLRLTSVLSALRHLSLDLLNFHPMVITLRGCKTSSNVIWLFDQMHA
ncbi:hypothetical protein B0H16DRAFT_1695672 [Mycena metata]|uniref:Uncharacterized protein n=1 Tax=Mycena metata TaxID=1033252 RepID=A0AAD7MVW8_9AGAR|nr:hypothetical protein B0H16DRAFT_1695672 [Mycena metata]